MSVLNLDQILALDDRPVKTVPVKAWGGEVLMRPMSGAERDEFDSFVVKQKGDPRGIRAALIAMTLCDAAGKRVLSLADAPKLAERSSEVLAALEQEALVLNGLRVEAAEKN